MLICNILFVFINFVLSLLYALLELYDTRSMQSEATRDISTQLIDTTRVLVRALQVRLSHEQTVSTIGAFEFILARESVTLEPFIEVVRVEHRLRM